LHDGGDRSAAEACFRKAIDVAQRQNPKFWEMRASLNLGRLLPDQGSVAVRQLLAPVYSWFTEGFDTAALKQAKALLSELA
jgi:predicted ATPase